MKKFWRENKDDIETFFWTCIAFGFMFVACQLFLLLGD